MEVHPRAQVAVARAVVQVGAVAGNAKRSVDHTRDREADSGGAAAVAKDHGLVTVDPPSDLWCGCVVETVVPIFRERFAACMS